MPRLLALSKATLLLMLVSDASVAQPPGAVTARQAYDSQTRRLENFFARRTQDEAALRSIYTRNAILVEADGTTIHGRDAIARHFKAILASGAVLSFKVTTTTFRSEGSVSYAGGYEDIEEKNSGNGRSRNRFFGLLRRGPDGVWRFDYIMEAR